MSYNFLIQIDSSEINENIIQDFQAGRYGIIHVLNANENTVEKFGNLVEQDVYGKTAVTIGVEDERGEKLSHSNDMLWHQDRAYSKDVHPFVGLYCIRADDGSSPTHYLDMHAAYANSSNELKQRAEGIECKNTVSKYYKQSEHPYKFATKVQERAYRMKNSAVHPLVWEDKFSKFYFYSEAYTETDLEEQLKEEIYKKEYMYSHYWKQNELLVYNNFKVLHKRDTTEEKVVRQHIRFALDKF